MPTTTVQVRMDTSVKAELEAMLQEMGLNMTTAMNLFAKAVIKSGKIPIDITATLRQPTTFNGTSAGLGRCAAETKSESDLYLYRRFV